MQSNIQYDYIIRGGIAPSPPGLIEKSGPFFISELKKGGKSHMAKNEPNRPEDIKAGPVNETPTEEKVAPTVEPLATSGKAPGDVVVSFDKINELANERKAAGREAAQETTKSKEAPAEKEAPAPGEKSPEKKAAHKGRPPKAEKADKPDKEPNKPARPKKAAAEKEVPAPEPEQPPEPREAPRSNEQEQIVYLNLSELYAFKDHPFQVKKDDEMAAMVESVKDKGVTQPAIVRPREGGGYEMVSGHRRQMASELAGFTNMPCVIRNLTDDEAITQMVEDNTNQREEILPSEKAKALKMQLEAIKRQGARTGNGQRSNEIVAERNNMTVKTVQRYIKLNDLVPDLTKLADEKKIGFTPAVEFAFIKPKNQRYIAIAVEGQSASPTFSQAKRMRELDQKGLLNPDMIDGIMLEEKKEVDKVILSSQELGQYFGKDKTPREMKDQIMKLLEENKDKLKDISAPEKKAERE